MVPKQKSTQRKDSQVERENGEGREGGCRDGGHAEVDRAGGKVGCQEEGQRVVRDSTVEARAKMHMYIVDQGNMFPIFSTCDTSLDLEAWLRVQVTFSTI